MKRLLLLVPVICGLFSCGKSTPADADSCAYDGYRKISFSTSGLANKDEFFDKSNALSLYYTFNYNASNDITSVVVHNPSGTNIGYIICTLNASGNSDVDRMMDQDSVVFGYETYTYDANDRLITGSYYLADSSLKNVYKYYYDSNNRTSYTEKYNATNNLLEKSTYTRNSDGTLTRVTATDSSGVRLGYKDYSYNNQAYVVTITYYDCTSGAAKIARTGIHQAILDSRIRIISGEIIAY
jgi:hypothetical protein